MEKAIKNVTPGIKNLGEAHKHLSESMGYNWVGMDYAAGVPADHESLNEAHDLLVGEAPMNNPKVIGELLKEAMTPGYEFKTTLFGQPFAGKDP